MAITNGTNLSVVSAPTVGNPNVRLVMPTLRARDGSFVGTALDTSTNPATPNLVAFDASGNVRWSVPGYTPQIATADGGFIAEDPNTGAAVIFDRNGSVGAQIAGLPTYSWKGAYQVGSVESVLPVFDLGFLAQTYAAVPKGNLTGNGFSLVHHTFGLVFCGPEGDGACKSSYPVNTTPTSFSYLPVASLNDQTYNAQPPTGPVDFSGAHPDWVQTIRTRANDAYKAAFASLPAIVSQGWKANPISAAQGFEHTVYVTGKWYTGGDFGMKGEVIGETAGVGKCNNNGVYMGICATSNLYYLGLMGYAQQALQFLPPGGSGPLSPTYPPLNATTTAQFIQVMNAIGTAIGNQAAHETGHQLNLPQMDCSNGINLACTEDFVYQNGNGSGGANDWFYGDVPGEKIHWSSDAQCKIYKFLGMKNTSCPN